MPRFRTTDNGKINSPTGQHRTRGVGLTRTMEALSSGKALADGRRQDMSQLVSYSSWNPANRDPDVTLSNANLTALCTPSGAVISTHGKESGDIYWEITVDARAGNGGMIGICDSTHLNTSYPGSDAAGRSIGMYGYTSNAPITYQNGNPSPSTTSASVGAGDVVGVRVNLDTRTLKFFRNGTQVYNQPIPATLGTIIHACVGTANGTTTMTANFGASAWAYPANATGAVGLSQAPSYTGYNATTIDTDVLLVSGQKNRRLQNAGSGAGSAFSVSSKSSGKWYWEVTVVAETAFNQHIGIGNASFDNSVPPGYDIHSIGLYDGILVRRRTVDEATSSSAALSAGTVVSVLLDLDARTIKFYRNGTLIYTGALAGSLATGAVFAAIGKRSGSNLDTITDTNFGNATFAYDSIRSAAGATGWTV